MNILQVVRRFGPVGGMERYVWELTRELAAMGHHLQVLCEVDLSPKPLANVEVHALGTVHPKPRWLAHIRFSKRVDRWLEQHPQSDTIIHSHERISRHQVTTFHGPPFAQIYDQPVWKRLSLRARMNLWLERRELCCKQVQTIVPNSLRIAEELESYYPEVKARISKPVVPGVKPCTKRQPRNIAADAGVIGFVGKEWKRKGLAMVVDIISALAEQRPNLTFIVAGPLEENICHLFKSAPFDYRLLGEVDSRELYQQFDLLLHPARQEPFGMVITEALSAGVPVVISDLCGAATEVTPSKGTVLALNASIEQWVKASDFWLNGSDHNIDYHHGWENVASEYEQLYRTIEPYRVSQ